MHAEPAVSLQSYQPPDTGTLQICLLHRNLEQHCTSDGCRCPSEDYQLLHECHLAPPALSHIPLHQMRQRCKSKLDENDVVLAHQWWAVTSEVSIC